VRRTNSPFNFHSTRPFQSNGMCLLDLPAQFHWNSRALTMLSVDLPHAHT
jgi:hypothetical protein